MFAMFYAHAGVVTHTYERDDRYSNYIGSLLSLYGSTMHITTLQRYPQVLFSA